MNIQNCSNSGDFHRIWQEIYFQNSKSYFVILVQACDLIIYKLII